jgi:NADPH-dependent glutamate synthase beta subunit-like oxidoreductase
MLLKATGQLPRDEFARDAGLTIEGGKMTSSTPHVFVGGDAASGGAEIVNAAAEGKAAAARIHALLSSTLAVA